MNEKYPNGWHTLTIQVSPNGNDCYAINGEYDKKYEGCDVEYYGFKHVRNWLSAYNESKKPKYPWYKKDRYGWPIETFKDKPVKSFLRIVCQNIRKITR